MRAGPLLLRVTSAVLGLQLLLGGLLTFGFISSEAHIVAGFALFVLSIATMAAWLATKPAFRPMKVVTVVIVVLILLQIVLGEATLQNGSQAIAFLHFVNATAIFGAIISGAFMAMRWEQTMGATKAPEKKARGS
jgi:heme A synthase